MVVPSDKEGHSGSKAGKEDIAMEGAYQLRDSTFTKGELRSAKEEHSGLSFRSVSTSLFLSFWRPASLCSTGCSRTLYIDQVGLKLKVIHLPLL